jgi:predicted heme/steroid binding protein
MKLNTKLINLKITKTTKIVILAALTLLCVDMYIISKVGQKEVIVDADLKVFDTTELARYSGEDLSLPIYLAYDGYVYDVTSGSADFYGPGQPYHDLVAKDSSVLLGMFGGEIIKQKYKVVGVYQK